jgi:hypothetical protein
MKRNSLTTALLAGLAGAAGLASTANAVNVNPDGLGQVLIYPYYTVNKGNQTLISVVNTTNRVKAVKVRFVEGRNSKEVLDFNLYMSPFDVWTSAVFATGTTGPANLITRDTSCTVPILAGSPSGTNRTPQAGTSQPFLNYQYTGTNRDFPTSAPNAAELGSLERTREGHLEMIEMGLLQLGTGAAQLAEEATHGASGFPGNCNAINAAWVPGGIWTQSPLFGTANIDTPAGGLYGNGAVIDVANGTMLAYAADAVDGFYTDAAAPGALHADPGTTDPDLLDADNGANVTSFVFAQNGAAVLTDTFLVGLPTPDAVSVVFMADTIYNEFNTDPALGASSEWVITFPTKRYYVDVTTNAILPFTNPFRDDGAACELIDIRYWDREEASFSPAPGSVTVSPRPPQAPPTGNVLCWEANVLTFNQTAVANATGVTSSAILGGRYAQNLFTQAGSGSATNFAAGHMRMQFDNPLVTGRQNFLPTAARQYLGLPTTGFWALNVVNASAQPGLLANYSGAFHHRANRLVS